MEIFPFGSIIWFKTTMMYVWSTLFIGMYFVMVCQLLCLIHLIPGLSWFPFREMSALESCKKSDQKISASTPMLREDGAKIGPSCLVRWLGVCVLLFFEPTNIRELSRQVLDTAHGCCLFYQLLHCHGATLSVTLFYVTDIEDSLSPHDS